MNTSPLIAPTPAVGRNPERPPVFSGRQMMAEIQELARKEPTKAVAVAFGVGLLVHLVPTRFLVGTVTAVGALLVRPVLLTLGLTKAVELCQNCKTTSNQPLP